MQFISYLAQYNLIYMLWFIYMSWFSVVEQVDFKLNYLYILYSKMILLFLLLTSVLVSFKKSQQQSSGGSAINIFVYQFFTRKAPVIWFSKSLHLEAAESDNMFGFHQQWLNTTWQCWVFQPLCTASVHHSLCSHWGEELLCVWGVIRDLYDQ